MFKPLKTFVFHKLLFSLFLNNKHTHKFNLEKKTNKLKQYNNKHNTYFWNLALCRVDELLTRIA